MVRSLLASFRPAPRASLLIDPLLQARALRRWRWRVFLSITIGYGLFYTTRLGLSVAKRPLLDAQVVDAAQLGRIGAALLLAYAVGKAVNGFLGDRAHLGRFFAAGLTLSALANLLFGVAEGYLLFIALWGMNGWFQSVGAACSGVSLASWFPPRELGTRYAIWSLSHNLGEGLTFGGTALLVGAFGWRWGFLGPGLICALAGLALWSTMPDRPASLGLPAANDPTPGEDEASVWHLQRAVLRTPMVWVLGLASALLYVSRYAINNWGMLYLQDDRGYTLIEAGFAISLVPLGGALGTVSSGLVSDRLFAARRGPVSLAYGALLVGSLAALLFLPPGHRVLVAASLCAVGFAVGGQMVFLGGLAAIDLCSKRASGAVMGVVGALSYVGAAGQDVLSGALLQRRAAGQGYDFSQVKPLWLGAACLSLLLVLPLLWAERRKVGWDEPDGDTLPP